MAPEASEKPKVKLEALFCFSHECYAVFYTSASYLFQKLPFFL